MILTALIHYIDTDEDLNTLTEIMNALVNLQAKEQAKGVKKN